jgi:hypothetical protein
MQYNILMNREVFILAGIVLLGTVLRIFNLSPFTIYPDSYQNLIVSENIKTYGSVLGFMGKNGMLYPDYFMWTRPLFPLLINAVSSIGVTPILAARSIALLLGIFSIPLSYFLGKKIFSNSVSGLIAAFLLAISYNHTVWSGLLMTETTGVFFMLLFLLSFFATVEKKPALFQLQNILTGVFFALAVFTRYEYLIIAIPVVFYTLKKSPKPLFYLTTIFGFAFITFLIFGLLLYPINSVVQVILSQLSDLLTKILIVTIVAILCFLVYRFSSVRLKRSFGRVLPMIVTFLLIILFFLFLPHISDVSAQIFGIDVSIFNNFFYHDMLLSFFAFVGLLIMLKDKKQQNLSYFIIIAVVFLSFVYYQINPDMERYMTHLIPFLLIAAAYGIKNVFKTVVINQSKWRLILSSILILFIALQIIITARGLRNLNDPSWFKLSYEQKSAQLTGKYIVDNPLLITSHPEPYFYFLHDDTQSIADSYPFIYIPSAQDMRTVVIVEDMGMRYDFPHFTKVLDTKLKNYQSAHFFVSEQYHYTNNSVKEESPVILYTIRLGTLRKKL